MPIPQPKKNESKQKYIQRFMSDEKMQKEFPKKDQRYQVQITNWKDENNGKPEPGKDEKNDHSKNESIINKQKQLIEDDFADPYLKLNIIESIQLSNKKYHLLEEINNRRYELQLNDIEIFREEMTQSEIQDLLRKYNINTKKFQRGGGLQISGTIMFLFFSILGGTAISLAGFIKMLLNSRRNKKIKRKLIKEIMDSKGMSKEDATKVTNYSIQKALEMTPEQLKRLSDKSKEKEVQKLMKNGQTVPGGNIN